MLIDDLLQRNQAFVQGRMAQPLPPVEAVPLAIIACYDPRLDPLLCPALGLREGEGFLLRSAGAVVAPGSDLLRSLAVAVYLFEVRHVWIVGHSSCRMAQFPTEDFITAFRRRAVTRGAFGTQDLRRWAGAIPTPRDGVLASAAAILDAPYLPPDLAVATMLLDDTSGRLEVLTRPGQPLPGRVTERTAAVPVATPDPPEPPPAPSDSPGSPEPPAAPALAQETLHPAVSALQTAVQNLAQSGALGDLRQLQKALLTERHPLQRLLLLRRFIQRTSFESPELKEAFDLLTRQVSEVGHDLATKTLSDLLGPLLGRNKP